MLVKKSLTDAQKHFTCRYEYFLRLHCTSPWTASAICSAKQWNCLHIDTCPSSKKALNSSIAGVNNGILNTDVQRCLFFLVRLVHLSTCTNYNKMETTFWSRSENHYWSGGPWPLKLPVNQYNSPFHWSPGPANFTRNVKPFFSTQHRD